MLDPADCGPACIALSQDVQGEVFDYPEQFFERVVGGLMASKKSLFNVFNFTEGDLKAFGALTYLNNDEEIDDFFWFQKVLDWKHKNISSFQVWSLKDGVTLDDMNDHWLYYEA